jgi:hypothetical protein
MLPFLFPRPPRHPRQRDPRAAMSAAPSAMCVTQTTAGGREYKARARAGGRPGLFAARLPRAADAAACPAPRDAPRAQVKDMAEADFGCARRAAPRRRLPGRSCQGCP